MVDGHRLTLGVEVVRRGDDTAETVQRLLWRARRRGIRMSSITVDRGFHSVDVRDHQGHGDALGDARPSSWTPSRRS